MILVTTLFIGLASWRWWRLVAVDTITEPLREKFLDHYAQDGWAHWLTKFVYCPWCLGFWIAAAHTLAIWAWGDYTWSWVEIVGVVFGASAVAGLLNEAEDALLGQ